MFFSCKDWETSQDRGKDERIKVEILDRDLLQSAQDLRLGRRFTFQLDNVPKHTAKTTQEWLRDMSLNDLHRFRQSPDFNLIEHLWRDLKIAVQLPKGASTK